MKSTNLAEPGLKEEKRMKHIARVIIILFIMTASSSIFFFYVYSSLPEPPEFLGYQIRYPSDDPDYDIILSIDEPFDITLTFKNNRNDNFYLVGLIESSDNDKVFFGQEYSDKNKIGDVKNYKGENGENLTDMSLRVPALLKRRSGERTIEIAKIQFLRRGRIDDVVMAEEVNKQIKCFVNSRIVFDTNTGGGSTKPDDVGNLDSVAGSGISKPEDPKRKGYNFAGWYTDEEFKNKFTFDENTTMPENSTTLYAKWEAKEFNVTFNSEGSEIDSYEKKFDEKISQPSNPSKPGYTFTGWYTKKPDGKWDEKWDFENGFIGKDGEEGDVDLYARFQLPVNFISNGENISTKYYDYNDTLPSDYMPPAPEGYVFDSWWTKKENGEWDKKWDSNAKITKETTLYAYWTGSSCLKYRLVGSSYYEAYFDALDMSKSLPADGKIYVQEAYNGKYVKKIADSAFISENIVSITLPSSITEIGNLAFSSCKLLKKINLPDNLTKIGDYAFSECTEISEITLKAGLTFGISIFDGWKSTQKIYILFDKPAGWSVITGNCAAEIIRRY